MKPTTLLCWGSGWGEEGPGCNHLWEHTGKTRRDGTPIWSPPHRSALTLDYNNKVNGKWKSASLAAYPAQLNKFIVKAILDSSASVSDGSSGGSTIPDRELGAVPPVGAAVPDRAQLPSLFDSPAIQDPGLPPSAATSS